MKFRTILAALAIAGGIGTQASALSFGSIGPGNDLLGGICGCASLNGYYGATLYLTGNASLTAEYIGHEAGATNTFTMTGTGGSQSISTGGPTADITDSFLAGVIDFFFSTSEGGGQTASNDGTNVDAFGGLESGVNFFVSFFDGTLGSDNWSSGQSVYLFFDDQGFPGDDDNHDDLIVKLSITGGSAAVPVPAAGLLLVGALGGLAALRRRAKKA